MSASAVYPVGNQAPPASLDAEAAVISASLIDASGVALDESRAVLADGEAFFSDANRVIFRAICAVVDAGQPPDVITVCERLRDEGKIQAVGGAPYIAQIVDTTPAVLNVRTHAEIVRDKWRLRQALALSRTTAAEILGGTIGESTQSYLQSIELQLAAIAREGEARQLRPMADWVGEAQDFIVAAQEGPKGVSGISTGFALIDKRTAGLQNGELAYIAGRPGSGKTAYLLALSRRIAAQDIATAIFSLEMPGYQVAMRLIAAEARVDLLRMRSGNLSARDLSSVMAAIAALAKLPLFVDDTPAVSVFDVRARSRRLAREIETGRIQAKKLGLIGIDYLQLMAPVEMRRSREEQVAAISRELKQLSKQLTVPVAALAQLNRDVERRAGDKRPQLSDLRESGQLEADADLIQFLYRPEYYFPNDPALRGFCEIITAKQRNGPTGTDQLAFNASSTRFDNLEDAESTEYTFRQPPLPMAGYDDSEEY